MCLRDCNINDTCIIQSINLPQSLLHRLEALGMTKNTKITIINKKGKGILIIKLRGSYYALGLNITSNIEVTYA